MMTTHPNGAAPPMAAERGMSLIEVLVSALLTLVILFTLLSLNDAAQKLSRDQAEAMQVDTNLRAGMELMSRDLEQAGAGMLNTTQVKKLGATIFPNRSAQFTCCTAATGWTDSEISMLINPPGTLTPAGRVGIWAELLDPMPATTGPMPVQPDWNPAEFAGGDRVIIIGSIGGGNTVGEWFTISSLDTLNNTITPTAALSGLYDKTSVVLKATMVSYYMDTVSGISVLMRREGTDISAPSTFPVAENVTGLKFQYYGKATTANELTSTSTPAVTVNLGRRELRKVRVSMSAQTEVNSRTKRNEKLKARTFVSEVSPKNQIARGND